MILTQLCGRMKSKHTSQLLCPSHSKSPSYKRQGGRQNLDLKSEMDCLIIVVVGFIPGREAQQGLVIEGRKH